MLKKYFFFLTHNAEVILFRATMIIWIITKLLSWKLWNTQRLFPTIPIWSFLDNTNSIVHSLLFFISIVLMLVLLKFYTNKKILIALLITEVFSCLLDINRLQPWEYQFIFILFIYCSNKKNILSILIFTIACIYIYSGLQKLNPAFLQTIWGRLILRKSFGLETAIINNKWVYNAGYIFAFLESICGFSLLIKQLRKYAAFALLIMHCFILLLFGPLFLNINFIIWPWNILMVIYLLVFIKQQENINFKISILIYKWNKVVTICWAILPMLGIFGYWDSFLSANLYSGKNNKGVIFIKDTSNTGELKRFFSVNKGNIIYKTNFYMNINSWSVNELNVPIYPEKRIFKAIEEKLKIRYGNNSFDFVY